MDLKGKVLISRNYRGDIPMSLADKFMPLVLDAEEEGTSMPIVRVGNVSFLYIKHNNLYGMSRNRMRYRAGQTLTAPLPQPRRSGCGNA